MVKGAKSNDACTVVSHTQPCPVYPILADAMYQKGRKIALAYYIRHLMNKCVVMRCALEGPVRRTSYN